jgi:D-xylose transport system substrate-binding protein
MRRPALSLPFLIAISLLSFSCGKRGPDRIQIGFLMETYDLDRWKRDETFFMKRLDSLGAVGLRAVADGDQDRQNKQADGFLTQGIRALVVVPKNLNTAARIVKSAHEKNVPVLAYDRLILNCDVDLYVTFDNEKVGYLQAKGILDKVPEGNYILMGGAATDNNAKMLREGQLRALREHEANTGKHVTILADPFLDDWDREEARRRMSNMLTKFGAEGKRIDAVVASNDATAGGIIAALMAEGLQGKVAVSGQDAELAACQRVVEGTQALTVYKPVQKLSEASAEAAVRLAKGVAGEEVVRGMGYPVRFIDNGTKKVPTILLEPIYVTRETMAETVIKDGWHPLEKVYANVPKQEWPK